MRALRQEEDYCTCRISLRLWPLPGPDITTSVISFLSPSLELDDDFVANVGPFTVRRYRTPKSKTENKVLVCFANTMIRDCIKAAAVKLSGQGNKAGIRIHVLQFLKANFKYLDSVCFAMKKKYPELKRSIKFDDDNLNLVADFRVEEDRPWQRITPQEAKTARASILQTAPSSGPAQVSAGDVSSLMTSPVRIMDQDS